MSISIPPDAQLAYGTVLKGDPKIDWAIFHLSTADSSLKVQATGSGLDDLEEEFMDGRIQYAFARVEDKNSGLEKFVQINWLGDGVADRHKGLFNTYSPQIASFLKNSHIVLQARSEADVTSAQIHKRMAEASGSKYSSESAPAAPVQEQPKPDPIPKVGGAYQKTVVDMAALRAQGQMETPAPVTKSAPFTSSTNKPAFAAKSSPASFSGPPPTLYPELAAAKPKPKPTTPFSRSPAFQPAAPPAEIVSAATPAPPPQVKGDDKIGPVGTAYTPVSLGKPGKLGNRWGAGATPVDSEPKDEPSKPAVGGAKTWGSKFAGGAAVGAMAAGAATAATGASGSPGKKLTWSERQAEAKRQREEEEAAAEAAMSKTAGLPTPPALTSTKSFGAGAPTLAARSVPPLPKMPDFGGDPEKEEEDGDNWEAPPPPPPMPPAAADADDDDEPPPPPPPPPMMMPGGMENLTKLKSELTLEDAPPPVPLASRPTPAAPAGKKSKGIWAIAQYDYEAAEDNEVGFAEGEEVTNIEQSDPDWWTGTNSSGVTGLFPSAYVELQAEEEESAPPAAPAPPPMPARAPAPVQEEEDDVAPPPPPPPPMPVDLSAMGMAGSAGAAGPIDKGVVAVAQYDYEAGEPNELSFAEGDEITHIVETSEDWWTGSCKGQEGLFPANYVEIQ